MEDHDQLHQVDAPDHGQVDNDGVVEHEGENLHQEGNNHEHDVGGGEEGLPPPAPQQLHYMQQQQYMHQEFQRVFQLRETTRRAVNRLVRSIERSTGNVLFVGRNLCAFPYFSLSYEICCWVINFICITG